MKNILKFSEAAALAIHTVVYLAVYPERVVSTREIATKLNASENHLSKVLQRLARVRLVRAVRGPRGGYVLGRPAQSISLLEVVESIDGPLEPSNCILGTPICDGMKCIFGSMIKSVNETVKAYLARTKIADLVGVYPKEKKKDS
ncbi:Rrf2 family transcriptional regulator [Candidatus Sumerlaeota bacterium]|nr:Rrf2 family transcriptional regulator [Candidatus Sumerlaeota bacterium]